LAPLLNLEERRALARAMLADVLAVARAARGFGTLLAVSRDGVALEQAANWGAAPLIEAGRRGYRSAAEQAAGAARAGRAAGLLILPADVPLITPPDLERLLAASREASVTLVPSNVGGGTNALLTRPPGAIGYSYGANSFRAHLRAAERLGLKTCMLELPNLALDVDEPGDLRELLRRQPRLETATWRYLDEIRLAERL
jgi:2-phospho-L-lactate/phosphoenolpyruvate guanylyltransferase